MLNSYGQRQFVLVPAGSPEHISNLLTAPSAITVAAMLLLSTTTRIGVRKIAGMLPPSVVWIVAPLVSEEVSVPLLMAARLPRAVEKEGRPSRGSCSRQATWIAPSFGIFSWMTPRDQSM